jgi:hypothetical protein
MELFQVGARRPLVPTLQYRQVPAVDSDLVRKLRLRPGPANFPDPLTDFHSF